MAEIEKSFSSILSKWHGQDSIPHILEQLQAHGMN